MKFVAKEDVKKYPLIDFTARVHLIEDLKDVSKCFDVISSASLIGFDTETKPSFKKGVHHHISLVQISVDNDVFLFRINKIGLIQELLNANPALLQYFQHTGHLIYLIDFLLPMFWLVSFL